MQGVGGAVIFDEEVGAVFLGCLDFGSGCSCCGSLDWFGVAEGSFLGGLKVSVDLREAV